jgi:RloB-like protein
MRKSRNIQPKNKTVAVIGDGECEFWYFQMLKRHESTLTITLDPKIPKKLSFEKQFTRVKETSKDYDKVFWIVDFDVLNKENRESSKGKKSPIQAFREYCNVLKKSYHNVKVIVNNPCLEFWFLLHFEPTGKYYTDFESAEKQLLRYLPDYEKTQKYFTKENNDIYQKLKPKLHIAIINSKKLGIFDFENLFAAKSEMYLFFDEKHKKG